MIIPYIRSSSWSNYLFCNMQYYINYVLGWQQPSNQKMEKGTIVHKVMECLAEAKKEYQTHGKTKFTFTDSQLGDIDVNTKTWVRKKTLTPKQVLDVNHSRRATSIYKTPCNIKEGHARFGVKLVEELIQRSYDYYSGKSIHKWTKTDFRDCTNWSWMILDHNNGEYDPRMLNVVSPETQFDIEITDDWGKYDFLLPDGKRLKGNVRLRGTIDLTTWEDDNVLHVTDYKTGERIDWIEGGPKTYEKLKKDPQLNLYYYALSKLYPNVDQIIVTIIYVRDGGPFTLCFEKSKLPELEDRIKEIFAKIKADQEAIMFDPTQQHFKCNRICAFYKNCFDGEKKNMCQSVRESIDKYGMDYTTATKSNPSFKIDKYVNPGE